MPSTLRPVTESDRELLISIYAASREIELAMTPWDAEQKRLFATHQFDAQSAHYAKAYPNADHEIITSDGADAGRIFVNRGQDLIAIVDLTILPDFRGRGLASGLIAEMMDEATATGRRLRVYVETFNPSQHFFFKRGFEVAGSDDVYLKLIWTPEQQRHS